ncbi:MAG TPA: NAD(P)-binding domain-containing protein, partial [Candidatus Nitrosotenuis sp.]|nr:NAD(P)-binding domain-containing protein [Candidatus Nitrosotenuis sp.]
MRIGLVGTGLLGNAVGLRILKSGYDLTAFNRTKTKTRQLQENGAKIVDTPKEVAENSDIVFTVVKNADVVRRISFGDSCISCGRHDGLVVADMSTINPIASKEIAGEFAKKGIVMLDTPVMGGPNAAINGELVMMVGGNIDAFEKHRKIFDVIANKVFYLRSEEHT